MYCHAICTAEWFWVNQAVCDTKATRQASNNHLHRQCSFFLPEGVTGISSYRFEYYLHLIKIPSHLNHESIYTTVSSWIGILTLQLMSLPTQLAFLNRCARSTFFFPSVIQAHLGASYPSMPRVLKLSSKVVQKSYVCMWPVAITLNYSVKDIRHDIRQII